MRHGIDGSLQLAATAVRASAEDTALNLAPVVLERVVQVDSGRFGGGLRVAAPDRLVDRGVFLDRAVGVAAGGAVQSDGAGLALQAAGLAYRGDEERVVRGGGDAEVEVVVAAVEQRDLSGQVAFAALLGGRLDGAKFGGGGAGRGEPAGGGLLHAAELEQHVYVVEVSGQEEAAPAGGAEHAFVVGDVKAPALLRAHAPDRREDLHRLAHHGAAGAQARSQFVLGRHPIAGPQLRIRDQLQNLLGRQLVSGAVGTDRLRGRWLLLRRQANRRQYRCAVHWPASFVMRHNASMADPQARSKRT